MIFANRKRNRRKPERTGSGFSLAWLKPVLAGGLQSVLGITGMLIGLGIMLEDDMVALAHGHDFEGRRRTELFIGAGGENRA